MGLHCLQFVMGFDGMTLTLLPWGFMLHLSVLMIVAVSAMGFHSVV